jgi:serine/threonine-protein kinase
VSDYEKRHGETGGWTDSLPTVSSGVYELDQSAISTPEEPLPAVTDGVRPPQFEVPRWVDTADERSGDTIAGYRVLGRIGRGAMGVVYLVDHENAPKWPVALKLLLDTTCEDSLGRFKRATLANSLCAHPGILGVFDSGETDDGPYLAMEFFDGAELRTALEADGKLEPAHALKLGSQLFAALGAAHQAGVVHRDVKPENILVSSDYERSKLLDFGIATLPGVEEVQGEVVFRTMMSEEPQLVPGTPRYMSPEQASYQDTVGPESDVYSMGLILYEMLAGRMPFEAESAHEYMRGHVVLKPLPIVEAAPELASLPSELHELVAALLAKGPSKRPTPSDAVKTLEGVLRRLSGDVGDPAPEPQESLEPGVTGKLIRKKKPEKQSGLFGLFGIRRG